MSLLLNLRLIGGLVIVAALAFSHFTAYRKGRHDVRQEWQAATSAANSEARALEQRRQSRADEAARLAAAREDRIRADSAGAAGSVERLRDAIAARDLAEESIAAANQRATARGKLLVESAEAYRQLAQTCDRHVNDLRTYIEAWPTN